MTEETRPFSELVKEAPGPPEPGTVSIVGTLAQSPEAGMFVLTMQDGTTVTLETASVKGYLVLGTSLGQTIVRVDINAASLPRFSPNPLPWLSSHPILNLPNPSPWVGTLPFTLATSPQAPPSTLQLLQSPTGSGFGFTFTGLWDTTYGGIGEITYYSDHTGLPDYTGLKDLPM